MSEPIFAKIARGEIPVEVIYEDDNVVAFPDIAPQAPVHILVIPKRFYANTLDFSSDDTVDAGRVLLACAEVARRTGIDATGFRVVLNNGDNAGQTVPYLHAHVLGGRKLEWPPG